MYVYCPYIQDFTVSDFREGEADSMLPSQRVMQLPELVAEILQHLGTLDPAMLGAAAQVNSLWADLATNCKWQRASFQALAAVPTAERRQALANRVSVLSHDRLEKMEPGVECLRHLSFPRLRQLLVDHYSREKERRTLLLRGLVNLRLTRLSIPVAVDEVLAVVEQLRGPHTQLEELDIFFDDSRASVSSDVVTFVKANLPRLVALSLHGKGKIRVNNELLAHLAGRPKLQQLMLNCAIDRQDVEETIADAASGGPLFAFLQRLHLRVYSEAVPLLVTILPSLMHLSLDIYDEEASCHIIMPAVASLRSLHSLQLRFDHWTLLRSAELLELRPLTELRRLKLLASCDADGVRAHRIYDECIAELVTAIGQNLRELQLFMDMPRLGFGTLQALGEHCPVLADLELSQAFYLNWIDCGGPALFPALRRLSLKAASPDYGSQSYCW
jgi:hypothetical protein